MISYLKVYRGNGVRQGIFGKQKHEIARVNAHARVALGVCECLILSLSLSKMKNIENGGIRMHKEGFNISFHISYQKNLSLKDLIEVESIINKAYGRTLKSFDCKVKNFNDYLKVESIQNGSVDLITFIAFVADLATIADFGLAIGMAIRELIREAKEKAGKKESHPDRAVVARNETIVDLSGCQNCHINIQINNGGDRDTPMVEIRQREQ